MKIISNSLLLNSNNNISLRANKKSFEKTAKSAIKEIEQSAQSGNIKNMTAKTAAAASGLLTTGMLTNYFPEITHCEMEDQKLLLTSKYNQGFFIIPANYEYNSESQIITALLSIMTRDYGSLGGLANYMDMVKTLKRQDLIKHGLRINTYELSINVSQEERSAAAACISKNLGREIDNKELFFIEDEAFYYDKPAKMVYSVDYKSKATKIFISPVRKCQFHTNENGNAIGYTIYDWSIYSQRNTEKTYKEQQEPSLEFHSIVNPENNKEFAEAFRFGNSTKRYKYNEAIQKILKHLSRIVNSENLTEENLQFVKFYNSQNDIESRICYYDSSIGESFVYNTDGKYLYQMGYNKDSEGNLLSCGKC